MTGKYDIEIYNNKAHYFLSVKRNITILQGNSATGKTELIRLVQEHEENGVSSGITLICKAKCTVLTMIDWERRLESLEGCIIFIDETAAFLKTQRFAELVKGSDNYFVIATRDDLSMLPYSIEEIYGLRNDKQKYIKYHKVYNEMFRLYNFDIVRPIEPEIVITEDSNSGNEFFNIIFPGKCMSANGKGNIYDLIKRENQNTIIAIVDGAAFGAEIGKIIRYLKWSNADCTIYAPESFEYILLSSGLFAVPKEVLETTYLYADSKQFMSWENYFTYYLTDITRNTKYQYGKMKLKKAYKTEGAIKKIAAVLPKQMLTSLDN